jgi:hypothetical protein
MTIVQVQNRFGDIVGVMSRDTALSIYRFLDESRVRQSLETNRRAIGYAEDGCIYHVVVCG